MNEHELSNKLQSAAATVHAQPDLVEIESAAGRIRSRRRVGTGVVAAMLIAGAGGAGFGLGRAASDDAATIAPVTETGEDAVEEAPPETAQARVEEQAADAARDARIGAEAGSTAATVPAVATSEFGLGVVPMELVYERRVGDIRIRAQRGSSWGEQGWSEGDWRPAAFCWATAESRITIDGPDIVEALGDGWYEELFNGLQVDRIDAGWADARPLRLLKIQTAPDVTQVAVTWDDGATDQTAVTAGVAVLVVDGGGAWEHEFTLDVTDAAGTRTLTRAELDYQGNPEFRAACQPPPPALPAAGDQPADPAAAEAALRERFDILWDRSIVDKPADLLDDNTGIDVATEQVFAGGLAESAESAEHILEELVFTSPTEAWFRYGIDTINGYFGERYGTATLVAGSWMFPRALVCQDLSLAGGYCEPGFEQIYPPSWYDRNGEPMQECWVDEVGSEACTAFEGEFGPVPATTVPIKD